MAILDSSDRALALVQNVSYRHILAAAGVYVLSVSIVDLVRRPRIPNTLPTVGNKGGLFSSLKNRFAGIMYTHAWISEGYEQYSKKGRSFVLPADISNEPVVVLPPSQLGWFVAQPDSELSASAAHFDGLHGTYSFLTPDLLADPYHEHVVHRALARHLPALVPEIEDEVMHAVDDVLGLDDAQWRSVNLWDALQAVVARLSNRMFVGAPLCREERYLAANAGFADAVIRNMIVLTFVPRALRPLFGPLLGLSNSLHFARAARYTLPLITARLDAMARKDAGDAEYANWKEPNDYVSWHIRLAQTEGRADELTPTRVAQRLMPLNFAAIHTTVSTAHDALLDLAAAPGAIDALREEAQRVYADAGARWSKDALGRMFRMDSALRESMRFSMVTLTLASRKIIAPQGVTNEIEGWHLPPGVIIVYPVTAASFDADVFERPEEFDAFRHSRPREEYEALSQERKDAEEGLKLKQRSLVTTGAAHLGFSHGRHACPGRFFVAHELKMLLAYIFMNYDIKPLASRPPSTWIGRNHVPPMDACLEIRRRPRT
ncbi:cytochrome P450 [Auricularia subglabra TFB-10046 SS5]|nr:cytochrome P450 [Auricularia subglabra TFB-10046 SS5]